MLRLYFQQNGGLKILQLLQYVLILYFMVGIFLMGAAQATCLKIACCSGQWGAVLCLQCLYMWQGAGWALVELLHACVGCCAVAGGPARSCFGAVGQLKVLAKFINETKGMGHEAGCLLEVAETNDQQTWSKK